MQGYINFYGGGKARMVVNFNPQIYIWGEPKEFGSWTPDINLIL